MSPAEGNFRGVFLRAKKKRRSGSLSFAPLFVQNRLLGVAVFLLGGCDLIRFHVHRGFFCKMPFIRMHHFV